MAVLIFKLKVRNVERVMFKKVHKKVLFQQNRCLWSNIFFLIPLFNYCSSMVSTLNIILISFCKQILMFKILNMERKCNYFSEVTRILFNCLYWKIYKQCVFCTTPMNENSFLPLMLIKKRTDSRTKKKFCIYQ